MAFALRKDTIGSVPAQQLSILDRPLPKVGCVYLVLSRRLSD